MNLKIIFLFLSLTFMQSITAQNVPGRKSGLLLYGTFGYKSTAGVLGIGFWFIDNIELKINIARGDYIPGGFATGLKINFFARKNIFASGEFSFRRSFAGKIVTDWNSDEEDVEYHVGNCNFLVPQIGINYRFPIERQNKVVKEILATFNLNYLKPLNAIHLEYVTGTPGTPASSAWFEKKIYRLYREGFGFSITASFYLQYPGKRK